MPQPYAVHRPVAPGRARRLRWVSACVTLLAVAACSSTPSGSEPSGGGPSATGGGATSAAAATSLAKPAATGPIGSPADLAVLDTISVGTATSGTAPSLTLASKPISVSTTSRKVLIPGSGEPSTLRGLVRAEILFVKGSDGTVLDSTYGRAPQSLELNPDRPTLSGLAIGLAGLPVGARALVAIPPAQGFGASGRPDLGISATENLVMVADILAVSTAIPMATGTTVAPLAGAPTVAFDPAKGPTITIPAGVAAPTTLVNQTLIEGSGPKIVEGMAVQVHYTGVLWKDGSVFDSSWTRGTFFGFPTGAGAVIPAWDTGLLGHTVGSRIMLIVPPADGYGPSGSPPKISGTDTLVFVIDILASA